MSEKIYYGGEILTMESELYADYLIAENGRIKGTGKGVPPPLLSSRAEKIDLKGRTLLPAFLDPHSHLSACANRFLQLSLSDCKTVGEIVKAIEQFISENGIPAGEWVRVGDYDHAFTKGKRLTAAPLDKASPKNPLVVQYTSGHMGIFNSSALKILGVNADTLPQKGGFIEKEKDGSPTGYMEESDFISRLQKVPMPDTDKLLSAFDKAQKMYFSHGIVTVQEGLAIKELLPLYRALTQENRLRADLVAYPPLQDFKAYEETFPDSLKAYDKSFKIGGIKLISDGSPQGRTAWMRTPYLNEHGKPENDGYRGYPSVSENELVENVRFAKARGLQLLVHCNGDMAAEKFIEAQLRYGAPATRPVMIHAQLLGTDQLDDVKRAGILPSFFVAHVLYWGDVHIKNFGFGRASSVCPLNSALQKGLRFTLHQDAPVVSPDMLETLWCATVRQTKRGKILGERERIGVLPALRAVTENAAYQYFEEKTTGSLAAGKRENLVLLSENPLRVPVEKLRDIVVEQTVKDGETVFQR